MIINLQCFYINSTKIINNKPFQVLQLFVTVRSRIQTCVSIVCRDLVHGGEPVVYRVEWSDIPHHSTRYTACGTSVLKHVGGF